LPGDSPSNEGIFRPLTFVLPEGSVVNATPQGAVSAGNVETSQRITDVVLRALAQAMPHRIPAASAGTMSNFSFGGLRADGPRFAYYETIPGGAGGGPSGPGESGVQTHMTNTGNTPAEELETTLPLRIWRFSLRSGSGGEGRHPGGDGTVKEVEFLTPTNVSIISDRRRTRPYGLEAGGSALPGANALIEDGIVSPLPGKVNLRVPAHGRIRIETPGGGGWGTPE
jgi:N-methylhydantoinase B